MARLTGDYRKYMNKDYLGSWDKPAGDDLVLTIDYVSQDDVKSERGTEKKLTLHFVENYKPMILNATNSKAISTAYGTTDVGEWAGKKVSIYTEKVTAFGGTTDALRIRSYAPRVEKAICAECGREITAHDKYSVNKIITRSEARFGERLCWDCSLKRSEEEEGENDKPMES